MRETARRPLLTILSASISPFWTVGLLAGRTLCAASQPIRNGQLSMPKVAANVLCDHVRHFLATT